MTDQEIEDDHAWEPEPTPQPATESPKTGAASPVDEGFADVDETPEAISVVLQEAPRIVDAPPTNPTYVGRPSEESFANWRRAIRWGIGPTTFAFLVLIGGLLGFWMAARLVEFYATIARLDPWSAWGAVLLLGLFAVAVLGAMGYFVYGYLRFRTICKVALDDLDALDERTHASRRQSVQEAAERIRSYLRDYPLESPGQFAHLTDEAVRKLQEEQQRLSEDAWDDCKANPEQWLQRFEERFQRLLDDEARSRVNRVAALVGVKTAVSPYALVDCAIVLYWSFTLLGDLCRLYQLRVGALGTMALLSRIFFLAYIAGRLNEFEESAAQSSEELLAELGAPELASGLLARVSVKVGAGTANLVLVRRLGAKAIELLQPVKPKS